MRPPPFRYLRAGSAHDALSSWHDADGDALFLSGGQDVLPALNAGRRAPGVVIDLKAADDIAVTLARSWTTLGATVPHLGAQARAGGARWAGYSEILGPLPIRARATVGGHIAAATEGRFWPTLLTALDGRVEILCDQGRQLVTVAELLDALAEPPVIICGIAIAPSARFIGAGQADVGTWCDGPGRATCALQVTVEDRRIVAITAAGCVGTERPMLLPDLEAALRDREVDDLDPELSAILAGTSDRQIALRAAAIAAINNLAQVADVLCGAS